MADVTLSSAVRDSLLSLQSTTNLIERTQGRLSTGLEVSGAIDDPVKFFQAKSLSDRASDFDSKKDDIDQGISTVTAALDATEAVEDIVSQLKGIALSAKSATSTQIGDLVSQFNDLRTQISNLTTDAEYQGLNLVNGTGSTLTVQFSNETTSTLTVSSVDITAGRNGLNVEKALTAAALTGSTLNFSYAFQTDSTMSIGDTITLTYAGESSFTIASGGSEYTVNFGGGTITLTVDSAGGTGSFTAGETLSQGETITLTHTTGAGALTEALQFDMGATSGGNTGTYATLTDTDGARVLDKDFTTEINNMINDLDAALTTLRTKSQTLGSNVALLQTRLEFTETYVNTLQAGSDKLTLADLNEEGANLLALQTRQQLGIQALSFAGQAEQGILGLFG
jgi:flagellin